MNNRIKMTDSKFKCNIFLFLSVTVFMARLSIDIGYLLYLGILDYLLLLYICKKCFLLYSLFAVHFSVCSIYHFVHPWVGWKKSLLEISPPLPLTV
jgi:hypothetical protein